MRAVGAVAVLVCSFCSAQEITKKSKDPVANFIVTKDINAYRHALKEAKLLVKLGHAGHPLGCASGATKTGTGFSYLRKPKHCFYLEISETRLIARACFRDSKGRYFWSAHYK